MGTRNPVLSNFMLHLWRPSDGQSVLAFVFHSFLTNNSRMNFQFFAGWIILVYAVTFGRAHFNSDATERPLRAYHDIDLVFYGAYGLMWLNGIVLIMASGVCMKV